MASLSIQTDQPAEGVTIVRLSGDAGVGDLDKMEMQFNRIRAAKPRKVIIDLAGLVFIASIGMGSLVSLNTALARTQGKVVLSSVNQTVMTALQRARLDKVFHVVDTVDQAMQA